MKATLTVILKGDGSFDKDTPVSITVGGVEYSLELDTYHYNEVSNRYRGDDSEFSATFSAGAKDAAVEDNEIFQPENTNV